MGGIYFLRKKLAEDDTDEEKAPTIPCNCEINVERISMQNVNMNRNFAVKLSSIYTENKAKLAKISKFVSKVERMLRLWFLYQDIHKSQVFPNKPNVFRCYLGKGITKIIFQKKDLSYVKWKSKNYPLERKYSKLLHANNICGG